MASIPPDGHYEAPVKTTTEPDETDIRTEESDDAAEQICLLHDTHAREILITLASGRRCGRELAEACDISRATAYRRLNRLEAAGFVTAELCPDPDGHHRKEFNLVRDHLTVVIDNGAIAVTAGTTRQ